ncbi:unnamed protein product [Knipowitschia caucasica]|uniref:BPTI/Kunitz inhibitor domain-containing protein n=1 Tax=Knipowitschia caucasica TaxID=637954 RepID=A0AAV2J800_KNICA
MKLALVLVVLCALNACTQQCEFAEPRERAPDPMLLASATRLGDSDPESCRAQCCARANCDAALLELSVNGSAQCFLLDCDGACTLREDSQYRVYERTDVHTRENKTHIVPLMLATSTRTEDNNETQDRCSLPSRVGMCKAAFRRWFFDSDSGSCQRFIFGGCDGNDNNFQSQEECEAACPLRAAVNEEEKPPVKAYLNALPPQTSLSEDFPEPNEMSQEQFSELCAAPPVVGPCRAAFPRWFYSSTNSRCELFIYGGCRGNKNNYRDEKECSATCDRVKVLPSKKQLPEMSEEYRAVCAVAPESGPCRASFPKFYYDPETQSCKSFIYGGCKGNENKYETEEECEARCGDPESFESRGKGHSRWTAAFFLFLALGAVSCLLLTALILITVRRQRNQRHLSIRSDKEELLPDSERASLDSLPLPESPQQT